MVLTYPLMSAIQLVSAHIGRVTGAGLASNLVRTFPKRAVALLIGILAIANTINIGADLSAMAASARLVTGGGEHVFVIAFAIVSTVLQLYVPYRQYARILKWLTLTLFAYVGVLLVVHTNWRAAAVGLVLPKELGSDALLTIVAVFGTTISPVSVLLAKLAGSRGDRRLPRSKVDPPIAAQRSTAVPAHAFRHADRDGLLQPHRARHHAGDRCHVAFARSDADQLGSSGGGRASTRCRRIRFRPVRGQESSAPAFWPCPSSPVRLRSRSPRFLDGRKGSSASRDRRRVSIRSLSSRRWSAC